VAGSNQKSPFIIGIGLGERDQGIMSVVPKGRFSQLQPDEVNAFMISCSHAELANDNISAGICMVSHLVTVGGFAS